MTELAIIDDSEKTRLSQGGETFMTLAKSMPIDTDEDFEHADKLVTKARDHVKGVNAFFKPHVDRAFVAHRALTGDRKKAVDDYEQGGKLLGKKMAAYNFMREEKKRKEREELQAKAQAEQDAACEVQAKELEDAGEKEAAIAVLEMKDTAVPVPVDKASDHLMSNTKFRTDWISTVVDVEKVDRQYLMVDEAKIQRVARAMKGNIKIAGVSIEEVQVPIQRGSK